MHLRRSGIKASDELPLLNGLKLPLTLYNDDNIAPYSFVEGIQVSVSVSSSSISAFAHTPGHKCDNSERNGYHLPPRLPKSRPSTTTPMFAFFSAAWEIGVIVKDGCAGSVAEGILMSR